MGLAAAASDFAPDFLGREACCFGIELTFLTRATTRRMPHLPSTEGSLAQNNSLATNGYSVPEDNRWTSFQIPN